MGLPALDEFPVALWARLTARRWRRDGAALLGYTDARGYPPLREAIARYAVTARGVRCTPDQVVVVNGAQHGVDLLARVLLDPGDAAWVEDPGWWPVRAAVRAVGARPVRVPVDAGGLVVAEGERRAPDARLAFVTPSYQAPLGAVLSLERRLALLAWAGRAGAWVLEDDYNGEYRYDAPPLPAVQGLDRAVHGDAGRVVYVGSLSKTLAPGLRLGYLIVPPALVEPLRQARGASDLHTAVPEQAVLADFLAEGHFARHVRRTRALYRRRQACLLALAPRLTHGLLELRPTGAGMQVLGLLPDGVDAAAVARAAAARGVVVTPLAAAAPGAAPHEATGGRGGLLLGFAAFGPEATRAALETLGRVLREAAAALPPARRR
jgi:GntR family transcriptional regulator/MocR family aminotransferase